MKINQPRLFDPDVPIRCSYERTMIETKAGGKSFCEIMGCWTNCRETGYCVAEKLDKFDFEEIVNAKI